MDADRFVVDTNILLTYPQILTQRKCVILACVLRELEKLKYSRDTNTQYQVRQALRYINQHINEIDFDLQDYAFNINKYWDDSYVDNIILQACVDNGYKLFSNDILLSIKAKGLGIIVECLDKQSEDNYSGYVDVHLTEEDLAKLYSDLSINRFDLFINQYAIIYLKDKIVDKLKWDGTNLVPIKYKSINRVKPINLQQELAFDMLQNHNITIKTLVGKFGSGKDYLMLTHALSYVEAGKFDKIVWARNPIEVYGVSRLGFLPGSLEEKSRPFLAPMIDHIGIEQYETLLAQGKLQIQSLSTIRGRGIENSIIYVTEGQNMTTNHMKLLLTRVAKGSQLWINGDITQTDSPLFQSDCGLAVLQKLKGQALFGQVELIKTERSETAELAQLL